MTATTTKPPSPRRCERIIQAQLLRNQGLTIRQIADRLGCAPSTVHAYLRDFQRYRSHILQSRATAHLVEQIELLTQPGQERGQLQERVAATRELRLLFTALPKIADADERKRERELEQPERDREELTVALARMLHPYADADGHALAGSGGCLRNCARCHIEAYDSPLDVDPNSFGYLWTNGLLSSQIAPKSEQTPTDPNISEQPEDEFPVPDDEFAPLPQNSLPPPESEQEPEQWPSAEPDIAQPEPEVGPEYPISWDNPFGYLTPGATVYNSDTGKTRIVTRPERSIPRRTRPPW